MTKTAYQHDYDDDEPLLHYGNWCGPNWTAGQIKPASELTKEDYNYPAKDALDACCKRHDIAIAEAKTDEDIKLADKIFVQEAKQHGISGKLMSSLVNNYGPASSFSKMPEKWKDKKKRIDKEYREEEGRRPSVKSFRSAVDRDMHSKEKRQQAVFDKRLKNWEQDQQFYRDVEDVEIMDEIKEQIVEPNGDFITPNRTTPSIAPNMSPVDPHAEVAARQRHYLQQSDTKEPLPQSDIREHFVRQAGLPTTQSDSEIRQRPPYELVSQSNSPSTSNMEEPQAFAARFGDESTNNKKQETPVDYWNQRELGILTNTRTAILPLTVYFSINQPNKYAPIHLSIRLNHWRSMFENTTFVKQDVASYASGAWTIKRRTAGISADCPPEDTYRSVGNHETTSTLYPQGSAVESQHYRTSWGNRQQLLWYPSRLYEPLPGPTIGVMGSLEQKAGSAVTVQPAWAKWYEKIYDKMSVIKCDYNLKIVGALNASNEAIDMRIFKGYDVVTQSMTDDKLPVTTGENMVGAGNLATPPEQLRKWKNVRELHVQNIQNDRQSRYVLQDKFTYTPGSIKKLIQNEEDIKTWYSTASDYNPNWKETVNYYMYQDEFAQNFTGTYHARLDMRWVVQYKELKPTLRYPHNWKPTNQTSLIIGVDDQQTPKPIYMPPDTAYEYTVGATDGTVTVPNVQVPNNT